jgi:hypothetical protein
MFRNPELSFEWISISLLCSFCVGKLILETADKLLPDIPVQFGYLRTGHATLCLTLSFFPYCHELD